MANDLKYLNKEILFTDTTAITVGSIPSNAYVVDIIVNVETLFNSGGADTIDIGTVADPDHFVDGVVVSATGKASVTLLNGGIVQNSNDPTIVQAIYIPAATAPSAGKAKITVLYAYNEDS